MNNIDDFYLKFEEPIKSTFLALKDIILDQDQEISMSWKYGMPFFSFKNKMFCYLWLDKKTQQPYIGIIEGKYFDENYLIQGTRSRIKIMLFDPNSDLPIENIEFIIQKAIFLYKSGIIHIK
jgi:hypothetical protein